MIVLIGLVILSGIIVNNAIVLVDYIGKLQRKGIKKIESIKIAAKIRWRPILMTTMTTEILPGWMTTPSFSLPTEQVSLIFIQ